MSWDVILLLCNIITSQLITSSNLCLSIMWMMNWMRIKALKLFWRKQNNTLVAADLCIEILLLIVVAWSYITCRPATAHIQILTWQLEIGAYG